MALIKCPECGKGNVSNTAMACPNCGFAIREYFDKKEQESLRRQEEEQKAKAESEKRAQQEKELQEKKKAQEQKKEEWSATIRANKKKIIVTIVTAVVLVFAGISFLFLYLIPSTTLSKAESFIQNNQYDEALQEIAKVGEFENSTELYVQAKEGKIQRFLDDKKYDLALSELSDAGDRIINGDELFGQAMVGLNSEKLLRCKSYLFEGKYVEAADQLSQINKDYLSSEDEYVLYEQFINKYKDSSWNGEWVNKHYSDDTFKTMVCLIDDIPYVVLSIIGKETVGRATFEDDENCHIDSATCTGTMWLASEDKLYLPYKVEAKGVGVKQWRRVGSFTEKPKAAPLKDPQLGMTKEQVEASSWGKPLRVNRTTYTFGVEEQWVYDNDRYIYFSDGIVTAISDH